MQAANARLLEVATAHGLVCWVIDHVQFNAEPIFECLSFLAFTAGQHPGLRWGTLVLGQGYRNPALVAKMAASLQILTGGRFILGLGAGDAADEHHAYGYPFPSGRVRIEQLDEAASLIRLLWQGGPASFLGAHYRIDGAVCRPRPEPPPRLLLGGGGERHTLRVVARHADWWNCDYYAPAEYAHKLAVLHEHCGAIGRDPATIVPSCYMGLTVGFDERRLVRRRHMGHRGEVYVVAGTPDEVAAQLQAFATAGVRHMQLNFLDFPRLDSLELFVREVLPRFEPAGV